MSESVTKYLEQLDISESEAKLYLKLLEIGPLSVSELAHTVGMKRSTAYYSIDQLLAKGLLMKLVSGSRTQVAANQPKDCLPFLVAQQVQKSKTIETGLPHILATLQKDFPNKKKLAVGEAEIKYYKGVNNARKIYEEALRANELRSYIRIDKTEPLFPNNAAVFGKAFDENQHLKVREIIYDVALSAPPSQESRSRKGRYFYKYMPKSKKISSEDILIYDGKVAVINFRGGKTSVVLHSRDLYNNFKEIFDLLWDMLPEPVANDS